MNTTTTGRSHTASRMARGVGVAALSTILIAGLAGCMTGRVSVSEAPALERNAVAPAGVDLTRPADRIAGQLAQQAATNRANSIRFEGRPADRIAEELAREANGAQPAVAEEPAPTNPYRGMPADRLEYRMQLQAE